MGGTGGYTAGLSNWLEGGHQKPPRKTKPKPTQTMLIQTRRNQQRGDSLIIVTEQAGMYIKLMQIDQ